MIGAEEFIALLEKKDLVSPELIEHLRRQIARPQARMSATLIAKWLVDRGHLSRLLAERLLSRAEESVPEAIAPQEEPFSWEKQVEAEQEELGLAPLDDEIPSLREAERKKPAAKPEQPPQPTEPRPGAKPPKEEAARPVPAIPVVPLLEEEVTPGGPGAQPAIVPLGGLMDESSPTASAAAGPLAPVGRRKARLFRSSRRTKAGKRSNVFDTPLMLIGGGALLALVILGGVLIWALRGRGADELLKMAEDDYRAGSYTQAIAKYDDFLERFPKHPDASRARVHRGLAKLRQATDRTTDWSKALGVAEEVLGQIAQEEEFSDARPELAAILPKIAQGLANQARADLDPKLVEKAEEALGLVDKYILSSARPTMLIDDIKALLALTNWDIDRDDKLEEAVKAMSKAVEAGDTAEAYKIRAALLKEYQDLVDNKKLREAVLAVSQAELAKVAWVDKQQTAAAAEPPKEMLATVVLARRSTQKAPPRAEGRVIYAVASGVAYALDAASGKILWRLPVGFATNGRSLSFPPTPVSDQAGSDAIMVDAQRNQVLRIEATTGRPGQEQESSAAQPELAAMLPKITWRHAIGERFDAHPVVAGDRLLVATRSGRVVAIDLETGSSSGYIQLPQELRVGPAVDLRRSNVYQVADHSNLFVFSLSDGTPKQVVYLGHEPGSVTTAPVLVINRYLVVAENNGVDYATLRVLDLEAGEGPPVQAVQDARLKGHVDAPPQVYGPRMLVATDRGELYVFEITEAEQPLAQRAQTSASSQQDPAAEAQADALVRFPLLQGDQIWIADNQLTRYELQATQGRLQPKEIQNEPSATLQPLVAIGQTIFHVRRDVGVPGVLVSAIAPGQSEPLWETHLAAPLATEPMIDAQSGRITAVTSIGAMYHLDVAGLESQSIVDEPTLALNPAEIRGPLRGVVPLPDGLLALVVGEEPTQLPVFDLVEMRRFRLLLPDPLGSRPIAFAGGLLAPCQLGQVFLLDTRLSEKRTEPFQPALKSGGQVAWSDPAAISENEFVLAEGRAGLYRVGMRDQPKPHLAPLAQQRLDEPIVSPLAVLGQTVFAVDAGQSLVTFQLPDLAAGDPKPLGAEATWGPGRVGDHVLLATDDDGSGSPNLYCLDATGKEVWKVNLPYGPLAGAPLQIDDTYVLAAVSGMVWRVESATGKELAKIETGCPLGTGPVRLGEQLLVGGRDGSLYKVPQP